MRSETYRKNMEALRERHPLLADWVEREPDLPWVEPFRDDQGRMNVRLTIGTTKTVAYNPDDPLADYSDIESGTQLYDQTATILFGVGAGHGLAHVFSKMEKKHIVVAVEPTAHLLRVAFGEHDFSRQILDRQVLFCPGKGEIDFALGSLESSRVIENWNVVIDRIAKLRQDYWELVEYGITAVNQTLHNVGTVEAHGGEMADNDATTLPYVIRSRGVGELQNLFEGRPAIVVATGPSLARNIHLLREVYAKKSAIIVAVAQALRPLLAYGVRPDFICTVDFGEVNMTHLAGLMDETVPLVTINKTYAPMLKAYRGPKFVSAPVPAEVPDDSVSAVLRGKGAVLQGGSVLHTCYGLAVAMGCSPIMLVGVDLALGETSHFGQVDSMGKITVSPGGSIGWEVSDPRSSLSKAARHSMGPAQQVVGYFGGLVTTNTGLLAFLTTLENFVEMVGRETIDCTEGGAYKRGTRRMFLREAMDRYCTEPIDRSALEPLLTPAADADLLVERAKTLLEKEIGDLRSIRNAAIEAIRWARVSEKTSDKSKLIKALKANAAASNEAYGLAKKIPILAYSMMRALRKIQSREMATEGQSVEYLIDPKNREARRVRTARNLIVMTAARDGADALARAYRGSLSALQGPQMASQATGETTQPRLDDAEVYFDRGNFALPMLEAARAFDMKERYVAPVGSPQPWQVIARAKKMREEAIAAAERMQADDLEAGRDRLPKYLDLVEASQEAGRKIMEAKKRRSAELGKEIDAEVEREAGPERDERVKKLADEMAEPPDFSEVRRMIDEAIELMPDRVEAVWGKASLLNLLGDHAGSAEQYGKLREMEPENLLFSFEAGQALIQAGRDDEGLALVKAAIAAEPDRFGYFLKSLGQYHKDRGEAELAEKAYAQYLASFPHDADAKSALEEITSA